MNNPFCGNCGSNLIDYGLVEICRVSSYADVSIIDGERVYTGIISHGEDEDFVSYECAQCESELSHDQIDDVRKIPMEGYQQMSRHSAR